MDVERTLRENIAMLPEQQAKILLFAERYSNRPQSFQIRPSLAHVPFTKEQLTKIRERYDKIRKEMKT